MGAEIRCMCVQFLELEMYAREKNFLHKSGEKNVYASTKIIRFELDPTLTL